MQIRRIIAFAFLLAGCLLLSGCFSIEQEVFLNTDGSGEFVLHVSLPDFPEELAALSPAGEPGKNPVMEIEEMTKSLTASLPPTVVLKQAKHVKQNGFQGIYMVFQFKKLSDMNAVLTNFGKEGLKKNDLKTKPDWSVALEKQGTQSVFTTRFMMDLSDAAKPGDTPAKPAAPPKGKKPQTEDQFGAEFEKLGEQMAGMLMGVIKFRFVLHAPSNITENNADIVLNGNTAVWNCSPAAFASTKKPILMRAGF